MSNTNQEHLKIAASVPEIDGIANGQHEDDLGSYVIRAVSDGDFVPMSDRNAMQADFSNVEVLASKNLDEEFHAFQQDFANNPRKSKIVDALEKLPGADKKLFATALFATDLANQFFAADKIDRNDRDELGWQIIDQNREDSYEIKKLSESSDAGYCVEYSLFVGEVMSRLGEKVNYTVGYYQFFESDPGEYHAFLSNQDASIIIDPMLLAKYSKASGPSGLFRSEGDNTILTNSGEKQPYHDLFGRQYFYSASPIPTTTEQSKVA